MILPTPKLSGTTKPKPNKASKQWIPTVAYGQDGMSQLFPGADLKKSGASLLHFSAMHLNANKWQWTRLPWVGSLSSCKLTLVGLQRATNLLSGLDFGLQKILPK
jgi:hypothetical protein